MPRESNITSTVLGWLNKLEGARFVKLHVSGANAAGEPDLYGCIRGRMVVIEMKVPGKGAEPLQQLRLRQWAEAGAETATCHSRKEVEEFLRERGLV